MGLEVLLKPLVRDLEDGWAVAALVKSETEMIVGQ